MILITRISRITFSLSSTVVVIIVKHEFYVIENTETGHQITYLYKQLYCGYDQKGFIVMFKNNGRKLFEFLYLITN